MSSILTLEEIYRRRGENYLDGDPPAPWWEEEGDEYPEYPEFDSQEMSSEEIRDLIEDALVIPDELWGPEYKDHHWWY